jgi:glycosyltransferase involved in cell wall biosynthesis
MEDTEKKDLSFLIPALNEEEHIGGVLESIRDSVGGRLEYEVRVIDNGSMDRTVAIAEQKGAICHHAPECTISSLRNHGGAQAKADILVFLDADVYLSKEWGARIGAVIAKLHSQPNLITGSLYGVSEDDNWIERIWFAPRTTKKEVNYLNGGHLILHSSLFSKLGGFDPSLETGEDYEFCERARSMGAQIENDATLKVVHAGYPKSIKGFFSRERWHARGDYKSFMMLISSKPALVSLVNLCMIVFSGIGIIIKPQSRLVILFAYAVFLMGVSLAACIHRSRTDKTPSFLGAWFLYVIYFTARTVSLAACRTCRSTCNEGRVSELGFDG